ncbi:MAG: LLM class F420-dependent oxidoreductase [Ilumatobacteraceae bacterium]
MRIGVVFPQTEIGDDPIAVRDFVQTAEGLGFAHLLCFDHVLGAEHEGRVPALTGPYDERHAFHEVFVLLGAVAAWTDHIELATGVLVLPQRQTALVAKQAAEVDLLSNGRLRLGVATGWNHVEYQAMGAPYDRRGALLDEQIEVIRLLWEQPLVTFEGRFHRIERAGILPRPHRRIPIWFGGSSPVALRRAVRVGDGVCYSVGPTAEDLALIESLLRAEGRASETFLVEGRLNYNVGEAQWEARRLELDGRGIDRAALNLMGAELGGARQLIDALGTYAQRIDLGGPSSDH